MSEVGWLGRTGLQAGAGRVAGVNDWANQPTSTTVQCNDLGKSRDTFVCSTQMDRTQACFSSDGHVTQPCACSCKVQRRPNQGTSLSHLQSSVRRTGPAPVVPGNACSRSQSLRSTQTGRYPAHIRCATALANRTEGLKPLIAAMCLALLLSVPTNLKLQ